MTFEWRIDGDALETQIFRGPNKILASAISMLCLRAFCSWNHRRIGLAFTTISLFSFCQPHVLSPLPVNL